MENIDANHERRGPEWQLRRYGIALAEFGPRWALIMKRAGEFDPEPVDTSPRSP